MAKNYYNLERTQRNSASSVNENKDLSYGSLGSGGTSIITNEQGHPNCLVTSNPKCEVDVTAKRKLILASVLCFIFIAVEIVGGVLANSLSIATDAAHMLIDLAGFLVSLFSLGMATRPSTNTMNFGWHRAEVIGAFITILLLWYITGVLCYMAVLRIVNNDYDIDATVMLITGGIEIVLNIIIWITLSGHGNTHGHSHNLGKNDSNDNINVRAALIHVICDFCLSIGVFVAALIIYFKPEWRIIDPICTLLFTTLTTVFTINITRDILNVFMEGKPRAVEYLNVYKTILSTPGVYEVHNLRIWSLTFNKTALTAHLVIAKGQNPTKVLKAATHLIKESFSIYELTLQIEEMSRFQGQELS